MRVVDLRSDTLTKPTPAMREAMYKAEVGDDVYGEDPTVRALEEYGARVCGKEAALFVTSGTMGNQLAVMAHTKRGDEIICESDAHLYYYEVGALAYLAGVQARPVEGRLGVLSAERIREHIRPNDIHQPQTTLICLENTHNRAGGAVYPLLTLQEIQSVARAHKIPVHMDGARIFNAATALGKPVAEILQYADSASICLSKGLGAPVGSLLTGPKEYIAKARKLRKMLGGGMRQAGVIAAAGLVALKTMPPRLEEDHRRASILAAAIAEIGLEINLASVETNIVIFDTKRLCLPAAQLVEELAAAGVRASAFGEYKVRMVIYHQISQDDIAYVIDALKDVVGA